MSAHSPELLREYLALLEYEEALRGAEEDLIAFSQAVMPDPRRYDDIHASKYLPGRHHRFMADVMMSVERGERKKVIVNTAPRHGKTQLCTKNFCAWYSARHPEDDIIVATYGDTFAKDFAKEVREIIASERFKQIFPDYHLVAQTDEKLTTYMGGTIFFLGRRSPTTGRGADLILVDDPTKDDKEVRYQTFREDCWQWFTQTLLTRRHTDKAALVVSQCMTGDTPVLMADGTERFLRDLKVGDRIATYDNGTLSHSVLLGFKNCGPDATLKIRMTSGVSVRANERHPFLVMRGGRPKWVRLRNLRSGDAIFRVNGESGRAKPVSGTAATSLYPAVGSAAAITASGGGHPAIARRLRAAIAPLASLASSSIGMVSRLMTTIASFATRAADALSAAAPLNTQEIPSTGTTSFASIIATKPGRSGGFSATTATLRLGVGSLLRRLSGQPAISDFTLDTIAEITLDAVEDVFDIMVDRTENFIANGLVSHNTRWHEDDIVGRISDKNNPAYSPKLAEGFEIINIPAIAMDDDPLGRKPGEALWPERFGIGYLEEMQEANSASFAALYQCDPTPDDGVFFRADDIFEYEELPQNLRLFCASDHAVATKQINDPTVLVPFGIDEAGDAYILPQIIWQRLDSERTVEEMLAMMQRHHPIFWYAEKGHISKSIGPFLRKRMEETGTYCPVVEVQPVGDKIQRAQSGRARCAQGKIRFPKFAPWWPRAKSELLKFPNGRFDDFVDVVSMIGLQVGASTAPRSSRRENAPQPGTFGYMLQQFREMDSAERAKRARSGW